MGVNKKDITNLMGLSYPTIFKAQFNVEEQLYSDLFGVVNDNVMSLVASGISNDENGFLESASDNYQAITIYYYLIYFALFLKQSPQSHLTTICEVADTENVECIINKLECLSKKYNTDFSGTWKNLMTTLGYLDCNISRGEFTSCEFAIEEFTQSFGLNVYKCN